MREPEEKKITPLHTVMISAVGMLLSVFIAPLNYTIAMIILLLSFVACGLALVAINDDFKKLDK